MYFLGQQHHDVLRNETPEYVLYDHTNAMTVQTTLGIISLTFIPFILITNSLVFWSTLLCSHLHTPLNILFFSLCVANLSMGCFCIPVFSVSYIDGTSYIIYNSKYHCLLWFASSWISAGGSLVTLLVISIDRYVAILWPAKYKSFVTVKTAVVVVALCWVYILIVALLPIMDWQYYQHKMTSAKRCNFFTAIPKHYSFFFTFVTIYLSFAMPLVLHAIICVKVYTEIKSLNRDVENVKRREVRDFEENVSTAIITLTLVLLFILLWFPYLLIVSFNYFNYFYEKQFENLQDISQIFYFSNAMVSAPVYALVRRDYKSIYLLMLSTPPWKWKNALRKLDVSRRKFYAFRFPSRISFIRRSSQVVAVPNKDATEEAKLFSQTEPLEDTTPKSRAVEHYSATSLYPGETTIY